MLRLFAPMLFVSDVRRSIGFYAEAFGMTLDHAHEEGDYAELLLGEARIGLVADELARKHLSEYRPNARDGPPAGFELLLQADDVDAAFARAVAAGGLPVSPPEDKAWGRAAVVGDPDGILVGLEAWS